MASGQIQTVSPILRLSPEQIQHARRCPVCQSPTGVIHQRRIRRLRDLNPALMEQIRLRCKCCGITWTAQPEVVRTGDHRSRMLRVLGVLLYLLGFSGPAAAFLLCNLGVPISAATIYRDVQDYRREIGQQAWQRWRTSLHNSLLGIRVIPSPHNDGNTTCGTFIFPIGQVMLRLDFSRPADFNTLIRALSDRLLLVDWTCSILGPFSKHYEAA